jgi:hypothetical protein
MSRFDLSGTIRRFLLMAAIGFWIGGFTFYASVVIPVGMQVLGGHVRQGFITQQVTQWLNISAIFALAIFAWNAFAVWGRIGKLARFILLTTLCFMSAIQIELFVLHPYLDRLLDIKAREVIEFGRFGTLHRIYLVTTTVQWGFGLLHVLCIAAILKD